MPNRAAEVRDRLAADPTLAALLPGGIYAATELGPAGISRSGTPTAFDADGWLQPSALVRTRAGTPYGGLVDLAAAVVGVSQVVEVYLYATAYADLQAAADQVFAVLLGEPLPGTWPLSLAEELPAVREGGALGDAWMARLDFQVIALRRAM